MKEIDISVIVPVYNIENYISECLDSILKQEGVYTEVICVDDGSTDASVDIIEEYAKTDERMVIKTQSHRGLSAARNNGLSQAKGKYICFVDGDDYLSENCLKTLFFRAEESKVDFLSFETELVFEDIRLKKGQDDFYRHRIGYDEVTTGKAMFSKMMMNDEYIDSACLLFINKEFIKQNKLTFCEGIYYEDSLFSLQCYEKASSVRHLALKGYNYRIRPGSTMTQKATFLNVYSRVVTLREMFKIACKEDHVVGGWNEALMKYMSQIVDSAVEYERIRDDDTPMHADVLTMDALIMRMLNIGENGNIPDETLLLMGLEGIVSHSRGVVLYGAGKVGKRICRFLDNNGQGEKVKFFAVTEKKDAKVTVCGRNVIPVSEIDRGMLVILAVGIRMQKELESVVKTQGIDEYLKMDRYTLNALYNYEKTKRVNPMITIIIPTHNSAQFICGALCSIKAQTYDDFEVIVVDSSSDGTEELVRRFARSDNRFYLICDENSSYGHKINRGIEEAQGQYIMILESDDEYDGQILEMLYKSVTSDDVDFVKCDYRCFGETSRRRIEIPCHAYYNTGIYGQIIDGTKNHDWWYGALNHIWTGIYKTDFLRKNRIILNESPGASYQDIGFSTLCNLYAQKVMFISEPLYLYRVDNMDSSVKSQSKYLCVRDEFRWIYGQVNERGLFNGETANFLRNIKVSSYKWNIGRLDDFHRKLFINEIRTEIGEMKSDIQESDAKYLLGESKYDEDEDDINNVVELFLNNKECVLFGMGVVGECILGIMDELESNSVSVICDNNNMLQGQYRHGIQIISPNEAVEKYYDATYIIASKKYAAEMRSQLRSAGVADERIFAVYKYTNPEKIVNAAIKILRSL